jgi:hypothetical protein
MIHPMLRILVLFRSDHYPGARAPLQHRSSHEPVTPGAAATVTGGSSADQAPATEPPTGRQHAVRAPLAPVAST